MKISSLPPLVFSFSNLDNLLDAISLSNELSREGIRVYRYFEKYYLFIRCRLADMGKSRIKIGEFGSFVGSGEIFRAFLEEHGAENLSPVRK